MARATLSPNESKKEANRVLLALSKLPPRADAASDLQQRAIRGERVVKKDDCDLDTLPEWDRPIELDSRHARSACGVTGHCSELADSAEVGRNDWETTAE